MRLKDRALHYGASRGKNCLPGLTEVTTDTTDTTDRGVWGFGTFFSLFRHPTHN